MWNVMEDVVQELEKIRIAVPQILDHERRTEWAIPIDYGGFYRITFRSF
jgi:hypothetical protein